MHALRAALPILVLLAVAAGCGAKKPASEPKSGDDETADGGSSDTAGGGDSDASAPPADDTPTTISCVGPGACSEIVTTAKEAAVARERCTKASGEVHESGCSRDDLLASCAIENPTKLTIVYYRDKNAELTRGRLKGAASSCKGAGGTLVKAPPPAGTKPKKKKKK